LVSHTEFEGRATHGGSFCAGCGDTDDNGHGTHVAAIAGGKTFGVANKVNLVAIKVFDRSGFGSFSDIIAGLSFVLADHLANPNKKSVVKYVQIIFIYIFFIYY
jgi:subtilisin family serine protease